MSITLQFVIASVAKQSSRATGLAGCSAPRNSGSIGKTGRAHHITSHEGLHDNGPF